MTDLTHTDAEGRARMVDVTAKAVTVRTAVAEAVVQMAPQTLDLIRQNGLKKGDVIQVARLAGILGAKQTANLIPLCHPLPLDQVDLELTLHDEPPRIVIQATTRCTGKTGVEMEALTAASVAALALYDMAKAVDRGMVIGPIRLLEKTGGRSGHWKAD